MAVVVVPAPVVDVGSSIDEDDDDEEPFGSASVVLEEPSTPVLLPSAEVPTVVLLGDGSDDPGEANDGLAPSRALAGATSSAASRRRPGRVALRRAARFGRGAALGAPSADGSVGTGW